MSWEQIPGWFGFRQTYDKFIAMAEDGDVFLEVGVAFGRSIAYLSEGLRAKGVKARIIGIDPWIDDWPGEDAKARVEAGLPTWGAQHAVWAREQGGPFNAFCSAMRTHSPASLEHVQVWRGYSTTFYDAVQQLALYNAGLRGIMIDGDHNYEAVRADIRQLRHCVAKGGILAGDDYSEEFPGVVRAVHEIFGPLPHVGEYKTTFEVML